MKLFAPFFVFYIDRIQQTRLKLNLSRKNLFNVRLFIEFLHFYLKPLLRFLLFTQRRGKLAHCVYVRLKSLKEIYNVNLTLKK